MSQRHSFFSASNDETQALLKKTPSSIDKIIREGMPLGKGKMGSVYRIDNTCYKIYHHYDVDSDPAERSARYWNKIYSEIYSGKYKHFATASYHTMEDRSGKKYNVLITPYIPSKEMSFFNSSYSKIDEEFERLSIIMIDQGMAGNIRMYGSDPLPIDFDCVANAPTSSSCFGCLLTFSIFTSPVAKKIVEGQYGRDFVNYKDERNSLNGG